MSKMICGRNVQRPKTAPCRISTFCRKAFLTVLPQTLYLSEGHARELAVYPNGVFVGVVVLARYNAPNDLRSECAAAENSRLPTVGIVSMVVLARRFVHNALLSERVAAEFSRLSNLDNLSTWLT